MQLRVLAGLLYSSSPGPPVRVWVTVICRRLLLDSREGKPVPWLASLMSLTILLTLRGLCLTRDVSLMPLPVARPGIRPQNRNMKLMLQWWQLINRPRSHWSILALLKWTALDAGVLTLFRTPKTASPFVLEVLVTTMNRFLLTVKLMLVSVLTLHLFTWHAPPIPLNLMQRGPPVLLNLIRIATNDPFSFYC